MGLDKNTPLNPETTPAISTEFGNFRVMVVDDSRTLRRILIQELNSLDITHIAQATHGVGAVELLKTEKLMPNIFPRPIAERLKRGEKNISGSYPDVSILFSDLVGKPPSCLVSSRLVRGWTCRVGCVKPCLSPSCLSALRLTRWKGLALSGSQLSGVIPLPSGWCRRRVFALMQRTGRAIRTEEDKATVVCYDRGLLQRGGSQRRLRRLPPYAISRCSAQTQD